MGAITDVPRAPLASFVGDRPAAAAALRRASSSSSTCCSSRRSSRCAAATPSGRYFASDFLLQSSTAGFALGLAPLIVIVGEFSVGMLPLLALPLIAIHRNTRQALLNEHQALHDALTGLPNRALFHDRVRQAIESARRDAATSAVMVMDLDHFKEINDTLGHYHGDRLLQLVGQRLSLDAARRGHRRPARRRRVRRPAARRSRDRAHALEVADKLLDVARAGRSRSTA